MDVDPLQCGIVLPSAPFLDLLHGNVEMETQTGEAVPESAEKLGYTDRSSIAKIESGGVDLPESRIKQIFVTSCHIITSVCNIIILVNESQQK